MQFGPNFLHEIVKSDAEKDFIAMHVADVTKIFVLPLFFFLIFNFPLFLDALTQVLVILLVLLLTMNIAVPGLLAVAALKNHVPLLLTPPAPQGQHVVLHLLVDHHLVPANRFQCLKQFLHCSNILNEVFKLFLVQTSLLEQNMKRFAQLLFMERMTGNSLAKVDFGAALQDIIRIFFKNGGFALIWKFFNLYFSQIANIEKLILG